MIAYRSTLKVAPPQIEPAKYFQFMLPDFLDVVIVNVMQNIQQYYLIDNAEQPEEEEGE